MPPNRDDMTRLRRVRWAVRATLVLGVAASVTANVLHARQNPIAQAIAAWPPLALLLTVELISRVPIHRRWLAAVRVLATATIASIAAWVSYWHMAGVAARYGEEPAAAHLIPLSVDGLVVVASVCLVELAGRLRDTGLAKISPLVAPLVTPAPTAVPAPVEPDSPADAPTEDQQLTAPDPTDTPTDTEPAPKPARRPYAVTQRAALALKAGGWKQAEIAELLDVSDRTVRRALGPATDRELASVGARPGED